MTTFTAPVTPHRKLVNADTVARWTRRTSGCFVTCT
jgi:hypothetical protein